MAETLPIKYVKDDSGNFAPVTSLNCVIDENGENIEDIFIKENDFPLGFINDEYNKTLNKAQFIDAEYALSVPAADNISVTLSNAFNLTTLEAGTYYLSFTMTGGTNAWGFNAINFWNGSTNVFSKTFSGNQAVSINTTKVFSYQFTLNESITFNKLSFTKSIGSSNTSYISQVMINMGENALEYREYSGGNIIHKQDIINFLKEKDLVKLWLEKVYPIGTIYISINNESPAIFLGGSWVRLPDSKALWTASSDAGASISPGVPNITGSFGSNQDRPASGAFYVSATGQKNSGIYAYASTVQFDASRSSSIYGASSTVQPPAYKVYAWRRES